MLFCSRRPSTWSSLNMHMTFSRPSRYKKSVHFYHVFASVMHFIPTHPANFTDVFRHWTSDCHCHVVWKRAQQVRLSFFLSFLFYNIFRAIFCAKSVIDWGIKKGNLPLLWMPAACLGSNRWVKAPRSLTVITTDEIGQKQSKIFIIIYSFPTIFFSRKQF
jgi:hypothetical protein